MKLLYEICYLFSDVSYKGLVENMNLFGHVVCNFVEFSNRIYYYVLF